MTRRAIARVNWGMWIADCPRPGCPNAEHSPSTCPNPQTHCNVAAGFGGLGDDLFTCSHCGMVAGVDWPADRELVDAALALRPVPATRNWSPGETLEELMVENVTHGIGG